MTTPPILRTPRRCVFMPRPLTRALVVARFAERSLHVYCCRWFRTLSERECLLACYQLRFLRFGKPSTALPLESAVSSLSTVPRRWDVLGTPSSRRGAVASWRAFAAAKWRNKHPWIVVEDDGVYCLYCKAGTGLLRGSSVFVSTPFTGTRPDKLVQHEHSDSHLLHTGISSFAAHI